jgi:hypothetical protein
MPLDIPALRDLPLTQKITAVFETEEPARRVEVVILDTVDGPAEEMNADWARGDFTLDDLFASCVPQAVITVTENGNVETYDGISFDDGAVLRELDGVDPVSVVFEDLPDA